MQMTTDEPLSLWNMLAWADILIYRDFVSKYSFEEEKKRHSLVFILLIPAH